jgi:two-component system, NarL family, invasion response regulator UvrY
MSVPVLLAVGQAITRRGVQAVLSEEFPEMEFETAANANELIGKLSKRPWKIVVLDLAIKGAEGLRLIEHIRKVNLKTKILIFSAHPEDQVGVRAMRAGADGFVSKDAAAEILLEAARTVLAGRRYLSALLAEQLTQQAPRPAPVGGEGLSTREMYVLRRIGKGKSTSEIADELQLSLKTISTYRSRVLDKLGLKTTADLVRYAIEQSLIE